MGQNNMAYVAGAKANFSEATADAFLFRQMSRGDCSVYPVENAVEFEDAPRVSRIDQDQSVTRVAKKKCRRMKFDPCRPAAAANSYALWGGCPSVGQNYKLVDFCPYIHSWPIF